MLNIGKMAPGSHDYYLSAVADRAEEYYLRRGEAPGRWLGRGVELLDLNGQVEADELRLVLSGAHPHTGERLASHPARKIPGFDLTFRAPKSVSLVWALGEPEVATQVMAAHEAAVDAAIGYVEREATRSRRGAGGTERVEVDGLAAAAFSHRTSRAGDPLLHTHVLVANLVRATDDQQWRTLESRRLYLHAKTAGYLYQAALRHELTRRLGVAWEPVVNGHADIAGIPRELINAFSQRRQAILERMAERGESSAKAAQVATLTTRDAKGRQPTELELREGWARRARQHGYDPRRLGQVIGRHAPQAPDLDGLVVDLVDREAVTEKAATFTRRDLLQAVAERLPDGATVTQVEALATAIVDAGEDQLVTLGPRRGRLAAVDTIRRVDGRIIPGDDDELRMTTRGLLLTEQHAITTSLARQNESVALVDQQVVERVLAARPTMTGEQVEMVRRLTRDGDGVAVVVGRAGTGKTFSLDAARHAWQAAGIPVRGVALAARAARELEESSGIVSTTIHRLLTQLDVPSPGSPLPPGSVLVVDEAGMVATRTLARLLDHAGQQQVKVVLVGDPSQLPEIDAGGLYAMLTRGLDAIELTGNRRQTAAWEIDALDELRHGDPANALNLYEQHGRIATADTAEALRERLASDWWDSYDIAGGTDAVMVALRQVDVDDLNHRARQRLHAAGRLTGPALDVDGTSFQVGDRVLCLRNDRRLGVVNGDFATIHHIDPDSRDMSVHGDNGSEVVLPGRYVDAGHVTHGYAITAHKAQGLTVNQTFVLGSDRLYREWGYVALSRGRSSNRLYLHPALKDPYGIAHGPQPEPDPYAETLAGLRRSAAHTPAVAYLHHTDNQATALLAERWQQLEDLLGGYDRRRAALTDQLETLSGRRDELDGRIIDFERRRAELGGLGRIRRAVRSEAAQLKDQLDRHRRDRDQADAQLADVRQQILELPDDADLQPLRDEQAHVRGQLLGVVQLRTAAAVAHPPSYLLTTIGSRPDGPQRSVWHHAVRSVEEYRTLWNITDPVRPLGDSSDHPAMRADRQRAMRALLDAAPQRALEQEQAIVRQRALGRGISR
ncbi:MAG: relaxase domain-containing protein [Actinomycetota bacterium]|nr:relaxase domain-containing protein [Actinomycetota bacterium]